MLDDRAAGPRPATMALGRCRCRRRVRGLPTLAFRPMERSCNTRISRLGPMTSAAARGGKRPPNQPGTQIPIAPAETSAPLPASSFPGGFRTPALRCAWRGQRRAGIRNPSHEQACCLPSLIVRYRMPKTAVAATITYRQVLAGTCLAAFMPRDGRDWSQAGLSGGLCRLALCWRCPAPSRECLSLVSGH